MLLSKFRSIMYAHVFTVCFPEPHVHGDACRGTLQSTRRGHRTRRLRRPGRPGETGALHGLRRIDFCL